MFNSVEKIVLISNETHNILALIYNDNFALISNETHDIFAL